MSDHIQLGHVQPQSPAPAVEDPLLAAPEDKSPPPALDLPQEQPQEQPEPAIEPVVEEPEFTNAFQTHPVEIISKKPLLPGSFKVSLPAYTIDKFGRLAEKARAADSEALEAPTRAKWQEVTSDMTNMYTPGGMYAERFQDKDSEFFQGVMRPDGQLQQFEPPKHKDVEGALKGELALLKVSKALGQGEVLIVPLPHSGINVAIKPPGERAIINFYNGVFREKIGLGRMSAGLTLTNFSVYLNNRLMDFIIAHTHSVNYGDIPKEDLRKYLKLPDFHILAAGLAATMYPNGFEYQRPCMSADAKCDYVATGLINLTKLFWVDNKALTEVQKKFLLDNRPGILSKEHYTKYQLDHVRMGPTSFNISNDTSTFTFHLRVPTFEDHVTDGMAWINQINGAVDALIVTDGDEQEVRGQMMQQYVKSSTLRQFSHYIEYMEVDGQPITERDTLNSVLEVLSADDAVREEVFTQVLKYKSTSTIAVVGIPSFKCPKCHTEQNMEAVNPQLVSVIPLDVINLFFTLLTLRMSRILER